MSHSIIIMNELHGNTDPGMMSSSSSRLLSNELMMSSLLEADEDLFLLSVLLQLSPVRKKHKTRNIVHKNLT